MKKYKLNLNYLVKKVIYNDKKAIFDGEFDFFITMNNTILYLKNRKLDPINDKEILKKIEERVEAQIKREYPLRQNCGSKYNVTHIKKLITECIRILNVNGFTTYEELKEIDLDDLVISEITK